MCLTVARPLILIPTFNERDNLARLLGHLLSMTDADVLVLDDASPDGTGRVADEFRRRSDRVRVLHRRGPRGLGHAYRDGFRQAVLEGYELIITMDADGSHSPSHLAELVELSNEHDLVIGSRWISGGSTQGWSRLRRAVSRFGCWYARTLLRVDVRDMTSGFRCYRRELVRDLHLTKTRSSGYAFQIETAYRALREGFRVREFPIRFVERRDGRSKMSWRIALEAAAGVLLLKRRAGRGRTTPTTLGADQSAS